jgi:hypothetical protein
VLGAASPDTPTIGPGGTADAPLVSATQRQTHASLEDIWSVLLSTLTLVVNPNVEKEGMLKKTIFSGFTIRHGTDGNSSTPALQSVAVAAGSLKVWPTMRASNPTNRQDLETSWKHFRHN